MSGSALDPNPQHTVGDGTPVEGQSMPQAESPLDQRTRLDREELLKRFIMWFKTSRDHFQPWRQEASICYDFVAGTQWSDEDLQILRDQSRPAVTFNRIGPFVDGVSGLEIGNRQTTKYYPRTLGEAATDELLTSAAQWARDECDAEDEESESFRDIIICGVGATQSRMDYETDPDGLIKIDRVDPLELYPDPASRKPNYDEAKFVLRVKDVPVSAAEEMFPDFPVVDLHATWAEDQADDARQPHNARIAPYYRIDQASEIDREQMQCRLVEVEWWEYAPAWRVLDSTTGRFVRLSAEKADLYRSRAQMLGDKPFMIKDRERKYYKAIVGNVVLKIMRGPDKGGFTYKFMTGKRDRNKGIWFGLVRAMMDPQMWANKFFTQALHIVNTNAKGGLIAETDAFVDIEEARDSWADADSITELNPGGINKVQQKQPPAFPVQINQMMDTALAAIPATAGVNLEMIAQQSQQQAGVLEMQRKQQGMAVLAYIFDAKRRYQKEQGRLMIWMLQTFISDGRLIRIGGDDQAQYVPFIRDPGIAEYDVIVDEAPSSPNMKERVWGMIMQMIPMMKSLNFPAPVWLEFMKYSPLPVSLTSKVKDMLAAPQPPNPVVDAKTQLTQAQAQKTGADAARAAAETARMQAEAAIAPQRAQGDMTEQQARIEKIKADAINSLQNAGVTANDAQFQAALSAIDMLLKNSQQQHAQGMDMAGHALDAAQAQHGMMMDQAGHALDVHQAMNPPPPSQAQASAPT